jgi:putative ABC transport system permease protein
MRQPWWQRAFLDFILLGVAGYGLYVLRKQGSIIVPGSETGATGDPFSNPLLFLLPALMTFALTLVMIRLLPLIMTVFGWLAGQLGGVGTMLAARQLARTPGFYAGPLLLLTLTLSLSAFTASLATTLDNHLYDQTYYKIGSDMHVVELGEDTEQSAGGFGFQLGAGNSEAGEAGAVIEEEDLGPRWNFLPVTEYLKVPGVQAAARVGSYGAASRLSGGSQRGVFMGIDRLDFGQVAARSWRHDYSPYRLGTLMNALASTPEGVLVPGKFLAQHQLKVGDTIRVDVDTYGTRSELDMKVVGWFNLWPTWYPGKENEENLFIGNLDYLYEQAGDQFPYDVWLKTDSDLQADELVQGVRDLNLNVLDYDAALEKVTTEQRRPERQGLFGFLSIGFAAAALLTVLGFFLYALFSFRRRFIELGILRAIGLSAGQMTSFLAWELAFLILTGLIAGTAFGVLVSNLFIPSLQVGTGLEQQIPPYQVMIAWPAIFRIWMLFAVMFVVALVVLAVLLMRMRIFQAVKLGETA